MFSHGESDREGLHLGFDLEFVCARFMRLVKFKGVDEEVVQVGVMLAIVSSLWISGLNICVIKIYLISWKYAINRLGLRRQTNVIVENCDLY